MTRRLFYAITLFLAPLTLGASTITNSLFLLTIPKTGTHCLDKYFQLFSYAKIPESYSCFRSHVSESFLNLPKDEFTRPHTKKILLVRDLRDVFLSTLDWIETQEHWLMGKIYFSSRWKNLSKQEKLFQLIDFRKSKNDIGWAYKGRNIACQINRTINKAVEITQQENVLLIHYETFSGSLGRELQIETFHRIQDFLEIPTTDNQYEFLADHLWGNSLVKSGTFRKGGAKKWKKEMDVATEHLVWELYGSTMEAFGYNKEGLAQEEKQV
jgi:hypothetical protein